MRDSERAGTLDGYGFGARQTLAAHARLCLVLRARKAAVSASTSKPFHPFSTSSHRVLDMLSPSSAPASTKNPPPLYRV